MFSGALLCLVVGGSLGVIAAVVTGASGETRAAWLSLAPSLIVLLVVLAACTDGERAKLGAFGSAHLIRLYAADGHVIQEWTSTGKVQCTAGGICDFVDVVTGKLVRTTGDIVVTVK